jgi:hypothetical protein
LRKDVLEMATPDEHQDPDYITKEVQEKWKTMLKTWQKVLYAPSYEEMELGWENFKRQYNQNIFKPIIQYLRKEWLDAGTSQCLLSCYTKFYLHFDNTATSLNEAAHGYLKRDLEVSTHDMLATIQPIERTITYRHQEVRRGLEKDRIDVPLRLLSPLFNRVVKKISSYALAKVASLRDEYLPVGGPGKKTIPTDCTGVTRRTRGIPCIHKIKECFEAQRSLSVNDFHLHWHLYEAQDTIQIDPRLLVLEPRVVRSRGRPAGSLNRIIPSSQMTASQQGPAPSQDSSTRRDPSRFERVISQEAANRGGRGGRRGRGNARARGGSTASNHQSQQSANQTVDQEGTQAQRGSRSRGVGRQQRTDGAYEGIPAEMTGVIEF